MSNQNGHNGNGKNGNGAGRPTKYNEDYPIVAAGLCRQGATMQELADHFHVSQSTLFLWKNKYLEFSEALKENKAVVDTEVENALLKCAKGFEYIETKIIARKDKDGEKIERIEKITKMVTPNVTAQIFWLKNRRPDIWRDIRQQEVTGKDGGPLEVTNYLDLIKDASKKRGFIVDDAGPENGRTETDN